MNEQPKQGNALLPLIWIASACLLVTSVAILRPYISSAPNFFDDILLIPKRVFLGSFLMATFAVYAVIASVRTVRTGLKFPDKVMNALEEHTRFVDRLPSSQVPFWIALAAGSALYLELMVIRIHACELQILSHFKNVSLLSCFLGLGIGYTWSNRRVLGTPLLLPLLAVQLLFVKALRILSIADVIFSPATEQWNVGVGSTLLRTDTVGAYTFLAFIFLLNAACFVPLGQLTGRLMARCQKLSAYNWNLVGSLCGIVAFALLCMMWTPPIVWLVPVTIMVLMFLRGQAGNLTTSALSALAVIVAFSSNCTHDSVNIYSPYQMISVNYERRATLLVCNNTWFQAMLDLRPARLKQTKSWRSFEEYYGLPYLFKSAPEDVLIVGSGSGNDVASALRHGAKHVDAVEIDPAIVTVGRDLHPENPYGDPRVHVIVDDARSVFKHTDKKYDMIIFGLLDSHTMLAGNSAGMRMDSYVWTVDSFKQARARLKPGGMLSVAVCTHIDLGPKTFQMLRQAFDGVSPYAYHTIYDSGITFVIGDGLKPPVQAPKFKDLTSEYVKIKAAVAPATDDWPFFFMFKREYPIHYASVILMLAALSILAIRSSVPAKLDTEVLPAFFLGAGFMLIETKGMTELSLVYGSTWAVTSIMIAAILLLALLANYLTAARGGRPINESLLYSALVVSLLAGFALPSLNLQFVNPWLERAAVTGILSLPLFFSGFAFSNELAKSRDVGAVLAANLMGAMLGGFVEFNSMYFGFRALYLVAIAMYVAAFACTLKGRKSSTDGPSYVDRLQSTARDRELVGAGRR